MSVFWALKPGRMPTTIPSSIPGRITHHSDNERTNNSSSMASEICMLTPHRLRPRAGS